MKTIEYFDKRDAGLRKYGLPPYNIVQGILEQLLEAKIRDANISKELYDYLGDKLLSDHNLIITDVDEDKVYLKYIGEFN